MVTTSKRVAINFVKVRLYVKVCHLSTTAWILNKNDQPQFIGQNYFEKKEHFVQNNREKKIEIFSQIKKIMAYHLVRVNNLLSYYKNILIFILSMQKKNWSTAHFDNIYASIWILFNDIWFLCCKAFYHLDV